MHFRLFGSNKKNGTKILEKIIEKRGHPNLSNGKMLSSGVKIQVFSKKEMKAEDPHDKRQIYLTLWPKLSQKCGHYDILISHVRAHVGDKLQVTNMFKQIFGTCLSFTNNVQI